MQPLHLKAAEHKSISDLTEDINGLSVLSAINYHADLKLLIDDVASQRDRAKLVTNGGRAPQKTVCIPPDAYNKIFDVAFTAPEIKALQDLLTPSGFFPIVLQPCRFTASVRKAAAKGSTISINMDTLVPGNDVTVTAMDNSDADLADPAPKTVTADPTDGTARVEMLIPAGYSDPKIKFRVDKEVVDINEFATHAAVTNDKEVHIVKVTS